MESIVQNIRLAEALALVLSAMLLLGALIGVFTVLVRLRSVAVRVAFAIAATLVLLVGYGLLLERSTRAFVARVAIVEGLDLGWLQQYAVPFITVVCAIAIVSLRHRHDARGA
jgi:hypothetical protein